MCLQLLGSPTTLYKTSLPGSSAKAGEDGPFATRPWRPGVAPRGSWPKTRSNVEVHFGIFKQLQLFPTWDMPISQSISSNIIQYPMYIPTYIPTFWFGAFPSDTCFFQLFFWGTGIAVAFGSRRFPPRVGDRGGHTHHGSHGKVATFPNRNFL